MIHTRLRTLYTSSMGELNTAICGATVPSEGLTDEYTPTCPTCQHAITEGGYRHRHHLFTPPATAPASPPATAPASESK